MSRRKVLISGATGFVGSAVVMRLLTLGDVSVIAGGRRAERLAWPIGVTLLWLPDLGSSDQSIPLDGVEVVVHSAARVHVMNDRALNPLAEFRKANVNGTLNLAREAARAGVRRFVFISSIKVNGEGTEHGAPYTSDDAPAPADPYGISKLEAERGLVELAKETGMEVVIIRPVLVYGAGVKANFRRMMNWLWSGVPLPFGAIHNKRSLVALENLVDLIVTCIDHPKAANQTFLVSDGEDLSTTDLLRRLAEALGRPARLVPVPAWILKSIATMLGKRSLSQRLCGTLQVDIGKTRELLGWSPPVNVTEALAMTARHFIERQNK